MSKSEPLNATDFAQAVALLPFYLNQTLGARERAQLEQQLQAHASLRSELALMQHIGQTVQATAARAPQSIGLAGVLARIEAEKKPAARSWLTALDAWLKPALLASVAIIGVQATLLLREPSTSRYRGAEPPVSAASQSTKAHLNVVFTPSTSEAELRLLLAGIGAQIVAGPSLGGEYTLAIAPDQLLTAQDQLQASGMTQNVSATAAPKP